MSGFHNTALIGASGQGGGYTIENSLRFRASASAYLSWTPASAGNRKTWTWSGWVKRGIIDNGSNSRALFNTTGGTGFVSRFDPNNNFQTYDYNGSFQLLVPSTQVFRDPSAWYHFVLKWDTTQATASNRYKLFVNGIDQNVGSTFPAQNYEGFVNSVVQHTIGNPSGVDSTLDGYLTEVNFIDGQALDPSSFGEYNADTGVWQPVAYEGTYGTNGFYLPFSDATNTTTLVADSSGQGNDWTPNNISLTAGATYDSMTDTPTPYADGGNYCTLSPIFVGRSDAGGVYGATNGNLTGVNIGAGGWAMMGSTMVIPAASAKYYFECTVGAAPQTMSVGVQKAGTPFAAPYIVGYSGDANGYSYTNDGYKFNNGSTAYGSTATVGDVIGVAIDASGATSSIEFYKNGTSMGVAFTGITGGLMPAISTTAVAGNCQMNFGQRPFAYTPPTDFLPLHTGNLPDSTIVDGSQYFAIDTYSGTGATNARTIGFQPDFVWIKSRTNAYWHKLFDSVRGVNKPLVSNDTTVELTETTGLMSFDSDGFTLGTSADSTVNNSGSGQTYVAWNWKAGGAAVTNTAGSITSQVSASPTAGFSVVTYTGTGANATVGHGLGVAPRLIIAKDRTRGDRQWPVYHASLGAVNLGFLNLTNAWASSPSTWNSTVPTSTVFSLGSDATSNQSGDAFVAYCFAEVEGYSKFGSYTGNGSTDGTFVYLGFRPKFILVKSSSNAFDWHITDTSRAPYNQADTVLFPNSSAAETNGGGYYYDLTSNGFKCRNLGAATNGNGYTYIYMAFAENPFKNSLAR